MGGGGNLPMPPKAPAWKDVDIEGKADDVTVGVNNYGAGKCIVTTDPEIGIMDSKQYLMICYRLMNWYACEMSPYCMWTGAKCRALRPGEEGGGEEGEEEGGEGRRRAAGGDKDEEDNEKGDEGQASGAFALNYKDFACAGFNKPDCVEHTQESCHWDEGSSMDKELSTIPVCGTLGNVCCEECPCIHKGLRCIFGICQGCERDSECRETDQWVNNENPLYAVYRSSAHAADLEKLKKDKEKYEKKYEDVNNGIETKKKL